MSDKQLEISIYDENSLLVKDYTVKKRWVEKSELKLLSDMYLPGYENKPIKIGVSSLNMPLIFIRSVVCLSTI